MITIYGMGDKLGHMSLSVDEPYELNLYGLDLTKDIGEEVKQKVETAFRIAKEILEQNIDRLHLLANTLLEKEKINEKEFLELMNEDIEKLKEENKDKLEEK